MNGTINLKKLSTKMLDAISTLNTRVDAVPSQIKTNNRQMLATVEQNAEAASRAYAAGQYLAVNGKLYKALNNIAQGDTLQENVNIEWVLLGDEISNLRNNLKQGAYSEVVNDWNRTTAGGVLDARLGPDIKANMDLTDTLNTSVSQLNTKVIKITDKLIIRYYDRIAAIQSQTGKVCTVVPKLTSKWITFPVQQTGYHAVGILGFYLYSLVSGSYSAQVNIYSLNPSSAGVSMAVMGSSRGDWKEPLASFYVLWEKD